MKKAFFAGLFTIVSSILFAQIDSTHSGTADTVSANIIDTVSMAKTSDTAGMAKIYVVRATGYAGSGVNLRVVVDSVILCKVHNNRYALFYIQPGTHKFNASSWDKRASSKLALQLPVEAGKTYYLSMRLTSKAFSTDIYMEEITYNSAAPLLAKYKQDSCD